jgi:hypothetical protein
MMAEALGAAHCWSPDQQLREMQKERVTYYISPHYQIIKEARNAGLFYLSYD